MKKLKFYSVQLIILLSTTLISCNKDGLQITKDLQSDLMSNPYIQTMFSDLQKESFSVNTDGVFVFDNRQTLLNVLSILEYYSDQATDNDTSMSVNDILNLFESQYKFQSMRSKIEEETVLLEETDNLFEYNDPDNYFIADDYFRTVINANGEIIVGGLHLILNKNITVGIMNNDQNAIKDILSLFQYNNPLDDIYYYCNSNKNTFIVSEDTTALSPDFYCSTLNGNPMEYSFENFSSCEEYGGVSYQWDFGDGSSSSLANPTHIYSTTGQKTVVLRTYLNGYISMVSKSINVGQPYVDFSITHNAYGTYFFTAKTDGFPASIIKYYWDFGDGTDTMVFNSNKVSHKYIINNASYNVTLTVCCSNGQEFQKIKTVDVSYKENCKSVASAHTGSNVYPNHFHIEGNKYIKEVVSVYSGWILHLLTSKAIYLQKNNNNSYKRIKANSISTHMNGHIYKTSSSSIPDNQCGIQQTISLSKTKSKQKEVVISHTFNHNSPFKVDYHSFGTYGAVNGNESNISVNVHNHQ